MNIASVEGSSFSGKTTLVETLKDLYDVEVIPEYDAYVGGGRNFPRFPPATVEEAQKSIDFFVEIEKRRSAEAVELSERYNRPVIMDRSPYSCIVFQSVVHNHLQPIPSAYLYSIERFLEEADQGNIIVPNSLIYLYPSVEQFRDRVRSRGRVGIDFLNWETTLTHIQEWFENLRSFYPTTNLMMLQSNEGQVSIDAYLVWEFLYRHKPEYDPRQILNELYLQYAHKHT